MPLVCPVALLSEVICQTLGGATACAHLELDGHLLNALCVIAAAEMFARQLLARMATRFAEELKRPPQQYDQQATFRDSSDLAAQNTGNTW